MPHLLRNEITTRLRLTRVHPKAGGSAERMHQFAGRFKCQAKGRHGVRLPYFVADDVVCLMRDPSEGTENGNLLEQPQKWSAPLL